MYSNLHLYNEMVKENRTPALAGGPCPATAFGCWHLILFTSCCAKRGTAWQRYTEKLAVPENASIIHINPKLPREVPVLRSASIIVSLGIAGTAVIRSAPSAM